MITILDLRGNIIHALHQGTDVDGGKTVSGAKLNTVGHCVQNFINFYLLPSLENSRLNEIIAVREGGNDYRLALYPEYKANRKKINPDPVKADSDKQISARVQECIEAVFTLLKGLGIPMVDAATVEADDVIAYLVKYLPGPKLIHTVDQDLIQLSEETVGVFLKGVFANKYELYNTATPRVKLMDVEPRHVALCKSIVGDNSDNYGGVPGMGPAKFLHLFENFGLDGLDQLCMVVATSDFNGLLKDAVNQTEDKVLKTLYDNSNAWSLGWKLANVAPHLVEARLDNKFNRLRWTKRVPDRHRVEGLLNAHGCRHLLPKLGNYLPVQSLITADNVASYPVSWFEEQFRRSPFVALDWETSDELQHEPFVQAVKKRGGFVDMLSSTITGAGFTFGDNLQHTVYISFEHADTNNVSRDMLLELIGAIPEDKITVIQNTMFEITLLKNTTGYSIMNTADTKVMSSYVDENSPSGLKENSKQWLNYNQIKYDEVIEKGKRMKDYSATHVFQYGADDPLCTAHLFDLYRMIMQIEGTYRFFLENENIPIEILSDGFIAGVSMDWEELDRQAQEDRDARDAAMVRVRELIQANQTQESISSGLERLFNDGVDEVEAVAKRKAKTLLAEYEAKVAQGEEGLKPFDSEVFVEDAIDTFRMKVGAAIAYEPYVVEEKPKVFDLTMTALNPVLDKIGVPRLTKEICESYGQADPAKFLKNSQMVTPWVSALLAEFPLTKHAQAFLRQVGMAAAYNDTAKSKIANGDGRAHQQYKDMVELALPYVDSKTEARGSELNLGSPNQMQGLLYGMLDLPIRLRSFELTDTKKDLGIDVPSAQANEDAIVTAMAEDCAEHPWKREALENILIAKKCSTRLSLFYDVYPLWKHPIDGLIHPQINSCGTETRRPSGSSPNALQWPKRGDGVKFRRCIRPNQKLGHDLVVSIDWSQQELRVAGALSMDEVLLDCYIGKDVEHVISDETKATLGEALMTRFLQTGTKDVHTQTATGLLKWAYEEVEAALNGTDKDLAKKAKAARTNSKPINFGSTYGIGSGKLARQLICPQEEAKQYLQDKKALYSGFETWRESIITLVQTQGYVTTVLGNRRHVHDGVLHPDEGMRQAIYRQVVNYLIQGVCADNLKRTLTEIYHRGILPRTGAVLIAPIYDELAFSAHHSKVVDLIMSVHEVMTRDVPGLAVPMLAEPSLGINFGDQIEIGRFPTPELIMRAVDEAFGNSGQNAMGIAA